MTPLPSCPLPRLEANWKDMVNEREEKRESLRRERKETERKAKDEISRLERGRRKQAKRRGEER
jgi:hypothetical protein